MLVSDWSHVPMQRHCSQPKKTQTDTYSVTPPYRRVRKRHGVCARVDLRPPGGGEVALAGGVAVPWGCDRGMRVVSAANSLAPELLVTARTTRVYIFALYTCSVPDLGYKCKPHIRLPGGPILTVDNTVDCWLARVRPSFRQHVIYARIAQILSSDILLVSFEEKDMQAQRM